MELKTAHGVIAYDDSSVVDGAAKMSYPGGTVAPTHEGGGGGGNARESLLILLPGMGDNRRTYRELVPLLVNAGHRVVTMDPRGQGETSAVWPSYSPEAIGADVLELVRHLDAGPATLVTNSYTGASSIWAAAEKPDAVNGLVLIAPFARQMEVNLVMRLALGLVGRFRPLWTAYWSSLFKTRRPDDFAEAKRILSQQLAEPGRMAALRAMAAADKSVAEKRTAEVRTPATVVMGTKDPDFPDPEAEGRLIADRLNGELIMIEGAGHYPQVEFPEQVAAAVLGVIHRANGSVRDPH